MDFGLKSLLYRKTNSLQWNILVCNPNYYYNKVWLKYGKEVIILKSNLSNMLYDEFLSSYQTCIKSEDSQNAKPFVYVNTDGTMRLLTDVVNSLGGEDEIFAVSVANDGFVEFLAFHDAWMGITALVNYY